MKEEGEEKGQMEKRFHLYASVIKDSQLCQRTEVEIYHAIFFMACSSLAKSMTNLTIEKLVENHSFQVFSNL
jgi:hypothetical protein